MGPQPPERSGVDLTKGAAAVPPASPPPPPPRPVPPLPVPPLPPSSPPPGGRAGALPVPAPAASTDVRALDLPRLGHVPGPVVEAVKWLWMWLWIAMFPLAGPEVALPLMFAWIAATSVYDRTVKERRRVLRAAQRQAAREAALRALQPPPPPPPDPGARARRALEAAVHRAEAAAAHLPPGALEAVHELAATVRPLLVRAGEPGVDAAAVHDLHALAGEYLPAAVEDYLRLPPDVATAGTGGSGRTPAEELLEQLRLLREGAARLRLAVHGADAERLATQRRFLEAKFRRSDLDL